MSLKFDKVRQEWRAFRNELAHGSDKSWTHNYVDFYVEKNRLMPYTYGHIEVFTKPLSAIIFVWWLVLLVGS